MFGISDLLKTAELAASIAMPELAAGSLLEEAMGSAVSQMAGQMFSGALSQMHIGGDLSGLMNAFSQGFNAGSNLLGTGSGPSELSQQILHSAFNAGLATGLNEAKDAMAQLMLGALQSNQGSSTQGTQSSSSQTTGGPSLADLTAEINSAGQNAQQQQSSASGGSAKSGQASSGNWLQAIAEAMGEALGRMASQLVQDANDVNTLSANVASDANNVSSSSGSSQSGAQAQQQADATKFQVAMSKLQADSQMFGILSNAFATSIKSIGDGMSTMAQKG